MAKITGVGTKVNPEEILEEQEKRTNPLCIEE